MGILYIWVCIVVCIVFGFLTEKLYTAKGYDGGFWVGFFLGIIGMIFAAALPVNDKHSKNCYREKKERVDKKGKDYILCENCGFPIYDDEEKCSNCGEPKK